MSPKARATEEPAEKAEAVLPERPRILIVDDDPLDRQAVVRALRCPPADGDWVEADVWEADTVAQAREALRGEEFACVFLAHDLPDGTSLDLLLEVRAQGLATPVIVLTGERDEQIIMEVMRAGAIDYLPKEKLSPDLIARSLRVALRFLQAQREKEAALAELRARDRAIAAASSGIVIADPRQPDCPLISVNGAFLSMTGYAEEEVLGRNCRFLQGPDTDPAGPHEFRAAIREGRGCQVLMLNYRKDGTPFWNEVTLSPVRDARGTLTHFVGVQADTTARHQAEAERGRAEDGLRRRAARERFLSELAGRAQGLTDPDDVIADAVRSVGGFLGLARCALADIDLGADTCTVPFDFCADETVASIAGVFPISGFGPSLVAEFRAGRAVVVEDVRDDPVLAAEGSVGAYDAFGIRAYVAVPVVHSSRTVSCLACHSAAPRRWEPEEVELVRSVVERTWLTAEVLRQQRALAREAEATGRILESITDAFFTLDHDFRFTHVNREAERVLFRTRGELLGRDIWGAFPEGAGSTFDQQYRRAVAEGVPVSFEEFYPPLGAWLEVRAYPSGGGLSVFFQDVTARKEAAAERERMLEEQRARADREALLNRLGQAIRSAPDPEAVLETTAREIGQALGADRCYYAAYDQAADTARVGPEWHRADLPALAGQYLMSRFAVNRDPVFQSGRTQVVADVQDDPAALELGLRALLRVPLVSGTSMTALSVAMTGGPREWTPAEVSLVEEVATQTQVALEAVRVRRREHAIAEQLARALQPDTPASAPGLALAAFYRPAWEEEGVGGDFSDVFGGGGDVTYLVVGDLSGKGLAAASEVATVRQMLRFALLSPAFSPGRSVAGAVAALNDTLAEHGLLTGFATLFVGRYEAGPQTLTFVNCGQDAGLLLRAAAGTVEELPHTGPVLGTFRGAAYAEETITLERGDVLALFTDGLSEAGPTRASMLGGGGVAVLLRGQAGQTDAALLVSRLMAGVDAHAGSGPRDDQCLLVGVASGP